MKPQFSFVYKDTPYQLDAQQECLQLDDTLSVSLKAQVFEEFNAVEWHLEFANHGKQNSGIIAKLWDCDALLPLPANQPKPRPHGYLMHDGDRRVTWMQGMVAGNNYNDNDVVSAQEYSLHHDYLYANRPRQYANASGRSSDGIMPFFEISGGGQGAIVAIGWTGSWEAEFTDVGDGVRIRSGLQHARFYLKPGEALRTSSILLMEYSVGDDASNRFRRLMREHVSHLACTAATREGLLAFEQWGGLPSAEMVRRLQQLAAHGIRYEDVWIDAGWYGQCTQCDEPFSGDWARFTGEWTVNRRVHPTELAEVRDAAAAIGMRLMLWIEPERAFKDLPVPQAHPDWFLSSDDPHNRILYYGNPEAWQYAFNMIDGHITNLNLSCYRQDFNTNIAPYFQKHDEENREGITEINHILGLYRLWDALLAKHPGLLIDNCSSGGRRFDIETLRRSIAFFRSDYQCGFDANPDVLQTHNAGIARYLPFNGCTTKCCDSYTLRSAYSSSFGGAFYNAVFQSMSEEDFAVAKRSCDEYRRIRRFFSQDFYNHGTTLLDETSWAIWQYHDPQTGHGIVMAFRRAKSPFDTVTVTLKGNLPDNVTYTNLNDNSTLCGTRQLTISLPEPHSSIIFEY